MKDRERRYIKKNEAIRVFSDENFLVVIPKTYRAAQVYSYGTTWCTKEEHSFKAYTFPLFIIIDKSQRDEKGRQVKHQLHFETETFSDEALIDVDFAQYLSERPALKDLFTDLVQNHVYKKYRDIETYLSMEFMQVKIKLEIPDLEFSDEFL